MNQHVEILHCRDGKLGRGIAVNAGLVDVLLVVNAFFACFNGCVSLSV